MNFIGKKHITRRTRIYRGFEGYHPAERIGDREWFSEENLSSRKYPLLCPREPRGILRVDKIDALGSLNGLCYIADGTLFYGGRPSSAPVGRGVNRIIPFGAYLLIFPLGIWVNTLDDNWGMLEKEFPLTGAVGILWCRADGTVYETVVDGLTPPENTAQMWLDTASKPPVLKQWSELTGLWSEVEQSCLRIVCDRIDRGFSVGSRVCFRRHEELEEIFGLEEREILAKGRDFIVLPGAMDSVRKELPLGQFELCAPIPEMDLVIAHENRLWGCRYGLNRQGEFVNEIYASKLGDFCAWSVFRGLSTDSYVASVGMEGPFTGCAVVGGSPVFFKENSLHRIYGTRPANFRIQSIPCSGVRPGCENSLAMVADRLFYHGRDGFCIYDGSLPMTFGEEIDHQNLKNSVAGGLGEYYYIAGEEGEKPVLLVYDSKRRLWHREDSPGIAAFCTVKNRLYFTGKEKGLFTTAPVEGEAREGLVKWHATGPVISSELMESCYLAGISLNLSMETNATLHILAQYDSSGTWESLGSLQNCRLRAKELPLRPRRCDHLQLRLEGRGEVLLHGLSLILEVEGRS